MSERIAITDNDYPERLSILQDLYAGNCSPQKAANAFASATLSDLSDLEGPLRLTWTTLIVSAREEPEHHEKLVEVLASIARLPDAENEEGEPLVVYDMQVWSDLPILGWELNYEWNGYTVPEEPGSEQEKVIARFTHLNEFVASLMVMRLPGFNYASFALWTMESALETPPVFALPGNPVFAFIPAAAAWISILGSQMYRWDEELEYDIGDSISKGGPLWENKPGGYSKERWELWRDRFGVIAGMEDNLDEYVRTMARQAHEGMKEIEAAAK